MVLFVSHQSSPLVHMPDGTTLHRRRNNKQRVSCAVSLLIIISSQTSKRRIRMERRKGEYQLSVHSLYLFFLNKPLLLTMLIIDISEIFIPPDGFCIFKRVLKWSVTNLLLNSQMEIFVTCKGSFTPTALTNAPCPAPRASLLHNRDTKRVGEEL